MFYPGIEVALYWSIYYTFWVLWIFKYLKLFTYIYLPILPYNYFVYHLYFFQCAQSIFKFIFIKGNFSNNILYNCCIYFSDLNWVFECHVILAIYYCVKNGKNIQKLCTGLI